MNQLTETAKQIRKDFQNGQIYCQDRAIFYGRQYQHHVGSWPNTHGSIKYYF
jgi:hypothetical protein